MKVKKSNAMAVAALLVLTGGLAMLSGCGAFLHRGSWFDPSRPIDAPDEGTVNVIYPDAGLADQTQELVPNATRPKPSDLAYGEQDYIIGPSDYLRVQILDLMQEGLETALDRQVSQSGYVDMPFVGQIKASGLTSEQFRDKVKAAYEPAVLRDATVAVSVTYPRQNTFSILGAVGRPSTYQILRTKFTLLEALAQAGDITQPMVEWLYVIRSGQESPLAVAPTVPKETLPELPPPQTTQPATPTTQPRGNDLDELEKFIPGAVSVGDEPRRFSSAGVGGSVSAPAEEGLDAAEPEYRWVHTSSGWTRVAAPKAPGQAAPPPPEAAVEEDPFGWTGYDISKAARIIAVNIENLRSGDARANIIIRQNDIVLVPPLMVGEFYVMGDVLRPGVYSLTGRKVTVKQAIAAAGNLGPLAWPNNSLLIRRIGRDQEQVVPLPLQDILNGREPDFFLKQNDVIAVGTHWSAPFLAVWRNAFRMTYGFGFIYDRNYSEYDFEVPLLFPHKGLR